MSKPMLSVGIIFKNEIRCLERCLKSLQPLRELIPMEIVMADTGSDDGSREVAGKYADILFDFPWINDFAAARNAVMDRCSGDWYFSIDADEWLGGDLSELATFVKTADAFPGNVALLTIYNYSSYDSEEDCSEFRVVRLARMSSGVRFVGAIHERWNYGDTGHTEICSLTKVFLKHDGYVGLYGEEGKAKRERNLTLLREELEQHPDDITRLTQYLESGGQEPDYMDKLRRALDLVREKRPGWSVHGPVLFRYAVIAGNERKLPEMTAWIEEAETLFPNSLFTRIDVGFFHFAHIWDENDYAKAISIGEPCLQAMVDLREGRLSKWELAYSVLAANSRQNEQELVIFLAEAYRQENQFQKSIEYLGQVEYEYLDEMKTKRLTRVLISLHTQSRKDTAPLIAAVWEGVQKPLPSPERARIRRQAFLQEASTEFQGTPEEGERPGYTLFLPLADRCEAGRAAQILGLSEAPALAQALARVEHWNEFPIQALMHALERGAAFPLPERPMNMEEMDGLATRLAGDWDRFLPMALRAALETDTGTWQNLLWVRGLLLAAVQRYPWNGAGQDGEQGMALARAFGGLEKAFLSRCYTPAALQKEGLYALPPMHRFGWYCAQAFDALETGDAAGYVHLLREGLTVCESVKNMVEFLIDYTPELQAPKLSAELLALAEQIRTVLAAYPADDPAVTALKQSEAYQKVAYLIEGAEVPIIGTLMQ